MLPLELNNLDLLAKNPRADTRIKSTLHWLEQRGIAYLIIKGERVDLSDAQIVWKETKSPLAALFGEEEPSSMLGEWRLCYGSVYYTLDEVKYSAIQALGKED